MRSQSEEVDAGVDGGGEKHEEAELFPHSQPGVQPEGEAGVLCAPAEIEGKYFFFLGGGHIRRSTLQAGGTLQRPLVSSKLPKE